MQLVIELLKSEKWGKIITLTRYASTNPVKTRRDYTVPSESEGGASSEVVSQKLVKRVCVLR